MTYRSITLSKDGMERMRAPELRALFPALMQLRIELTFVFDARRPPADQTHILHPSARAYFCYPCPIHGCTGGFKLDGPAVRVLKAFLPGTEGEIGCSGVRPEGRLTGNPCETRLKFRIDAVYGTA